MRIIKRQINKEESISRIPSLFPYLDYDDMGNLTLHNATDSIDGSYGKLMPDFKLKYNGQEKIFSYRTLMYYYRNNVDITFTFTKENNEGGKISIEYTIGEFIEYAIGKIGKIEVKKRDEKGEEVLVPIQGKLVPEYIFLSQVRKLYTEMMSLKEIAPSDKCAKCKYDDMGGDDMIEFLKDQFSEIDTRAGKLKDLATTPTKGFMLSINLTSSIRDLGYMTTNMLPMDRSDVGDVQQDEDIIIDEQPREVTVTAYADSKLKSLRRYETYINEFGISEMPPEGEDWLYFYRIETPINYTDIDKETVCASWIKEISQATRKVENGTDETETVLVNAITFTYIINGILPKTEAGKFDFNSAEGGVIYTETYEYEGRGDLSNLVNNGCLENYVTSTAKYCTTIEGTKKIEYHYNGLEKFEFKTTPNTTFVNKKINNDISKYDYIISQLTYSHTHEKLLQEKFNILKEDYLLGISYPPQVKTDVRIDRGNSAALERHLKLSEIKTLEDMENYRNGSFFNIQRQL